MITLPNMMTSNTTSDGYHTFDELYYHRGILFSSLCNLMRDKAWKSKAHHDGTMYPGMFIAGITTEYGETTYHFEDYMWDIVNARVLDRAPEFDGHTPNDVLLRLYNSTYNMSNKSI